MPLCVAVARRPALAGVQHVDQRAAGVAHRFQNLLDAAAPSVFDDETGVGGDVGFEVGVDPPRIGGGDFDPRVVQPARERPAFDEKVDLEARQEDFVEGPDDQLVLTDSQNSHVSFPQGADPALRRHHGAHPEARQTAIIRWVGEKRMSGYHARSHPGEVS